MTIARLNSHKVTLNTNKVTLNTILSGLVILGGISLPIKSIAAPDYGNCTPSQWSALSREVSRTCKGSDRGSRCNSGMGLNELIENENKFLACANARLTISNTCYGGEDFGHNIERTNALRAAERCRNFRMCPIPRQGANSRAICR